MSTCQTTALFLVPLEDRRLGGGIHGGRRDRLLHHNGGGLLYHDRCRLLHDDGRRCRHTLDNRFGRAGDQSADQSADESAVMVVMMPRRRRCVSRTAVVMPGSRRRRRDSRRTVVARGGSRRADVPATRGVPRSRFRAGGCRKDGQCGNSDQAECGGEGFVGVVHGVSPFGLRGCARRSCLTLYYSYINYSFSK